MTIMLIGPNWTKDDVETGALMSGMSGKFLASCLSHVGISFDECYKTSVFDFYPTGGDLKNVVVGKAEALKGYPALIKGKYIPANYAGQLARLEQEIKRTNPTLIISLGATSAWALLKTKGIKNIRGAPLPYTLGNRTYKVLPTYDPSAIFREWKLRPIFFSDLYKARKESEFPEVIRPSRSIWIKPSYEDLLRFEQEYILPSSDLSIDIETAGTQITCIGFAPTKDIALVVPFTDDENSSRSYWPTVADEIQAWNWVKRICALPKAIVGQNFLYDVHHLWRNYGIPVPHATNDTMLLHHALQPEMQKGLGFLGSIYTDEASWKFMRHVETIKREE